MEDVTLKQLFMQYSAQRGVYAEELKNTIASFGAVSSEEGGPLGALPRTWIDLKSTLISGDRDIRQIITTQLSGAEAILNSVHYLIAVAKD